MNEIKTLIDVFPEWYNGAIFSELVENYEVPWRSLNNGLSMDIEYFGNKSGGRIISPLVERLLNEEGELTEANKTVLLNIIFNRYRESWGKLWDAITATYSPLENYNLTETEEENNEGTNERTESTTGSETETTTEDNEASETVTESETVEGTKTDTGTLSNTGTKVTDRDGTESATTSSTSSENGENGVYGYNSLESVGDTTSEQTGTETGTESRTNAEDISETLNNTETENKTHTTEEERAKSNTKSNTEDKSGSRQNTTTESKTGSEETTGQRTRELTRSGNIGVTTSQQMLESEIELRMNYNFYDIIYKNVDEVLALSVFK